MQNTYQNNIYQTAKNYLVRGILIAGITLVPKIAMGKTSEKYAPVKKEKIVNILDKGWNYGSIDERLKNIKNIGDVAETAALYPLDWFNDVVIRSPVAVVHDIPKEAMNRAKKIKAREYAKKQRYAKKGPIEGIGEFVGDTGRFLGQYIMVSLEGAGEQITKRPLETIAHLGTGYFIGKAISDAAHRTEHHVGVGGEEAPPLPPPFPGP